MLLLPLAKIGWDAFQGDLGANPIEAVQNRLGFWTITLLALSLVPTPAWDLFRVGWPQRLRRVLGVTAFTYALLHFLFYVGVDKFFDWATISKDLTRRPFLMVGFAALLCLTPLAITSTDGWVRRLGFRRWKLLHRLVYLAAALAVVHFAWRVKADLTPAAPLRGRLRAAARAAGPGLDPGGPAGRAEASASGVRPAGA